jgi:hypothetical protein
MIEDWTRNHYLVFVISNFVEKDGRRTRRSPVQGPKETFGRYPSLSIKYVGTSWSIVICNISVRVSILHVLFSGIKFIFVIPPLYITPVSGYLCSCIENKYVSCYNNEASICQLHDDKSWDYPI